jgi:iron complex outermembrane receptor protein
MLHLAIMQKRIPLVILAILATMSLAWSQIVTGMVNDAQGNALPGAFITGVSDSEEVVAITNSLVDGSYNLDLTLWSGKSIRLRCSYIGMEKEEKSLGILESERAYTVNWALEDAAELIGQVVVSAGRFEQSANEVTVSIDVIPPRIVESRGTTTLETALEMNPGVTFVNGEPQIRSGSGFSYGAGSRVMIMVDDLPVLSGDAGRPTWGFLPVENIEQIEIIKGASSVLFGSAALSGVINVRTRFPDARPLTRVSVQHGVYSTPRTNRAKYWKGAAQQSNIRFLHSQQMGSWDVVIGGNFLGDDGFLAPEDVAANDAAKFRFQPWKVDRFGAEYRARLNANIRKRESSVEGLSYGVNTNWQLGESLNTLIWQSAPDSIYGAFDGAATRTNQLIGTVDPYVQYLSPTGIRHNLRTRWQYLNNDNDNDQSNGSHVIYGEYQVFIDGNRWNVPGLKITTGLVNLTALSRAELYSGGSSDGNNTATNQSAYVQFDQSIGDRFNLSGGARYEHFTVNGSGAGKPVFRIGGNYQLAEATFLRSSYGQGFRFPTIAERYIRTGLGALQIYPNEELRPEYSWSAEIGLKQGFKLGSFAGFLDLAVFRQDFSDFIEFTFGPWGPDEGESPNEANAYGLGFMSVNTGGSKVTGGEISINGRLQMDRVRIDVLTGYTYTNPVSTTPGDNYNPDSTSNYAATYYGTSHDTTGLILKYRSPHVFRFDAQVSGAKWFGGLSVRYQTNLRNFDQAFISFEENPAISGINWGARDWLERNPSLPWIIDARFGREWSNGHKVTLVMNNITNEEYAIRPMAMEAPRLTTLMYTYEIN